MSISDHLTYMINVNRSATNGFLGEITEEESLDRIDGRFNHVRWLAGHMLYSMGQVLAALDPKFDGHEEYKPKFAGGTIPSEDPTDYPPLSELKSNLDKVYENVSSALEQASDDDLLREMGGEDGSTPVWKMITFLCMHDFYHSGQIMYHRRGVGRKWPFGK